MDDDVRRRWHELGDQMSALGTLMRRRFAAPGDEPTEAAHDAQAAIQQALDRLAAAGRQLGERVAEVARDDDVRATARDTMASLDQALRATVDLVVDEVEGVVKPVRRTDH